MERDYKLTIAVISGASHALKHKGENPRATDDEVVQHITQNAEEILKKIDEEED